MLHEALERLNELKLLFKKSIPSESNIPLEQQEVKCHEYEPKLKRPRDLTLRKKKDKFNAKHGETSERFKVAKDNQNNSITRCTSRKSSGNGRNVRPSRRVIKYPRH